MPLTRRRHVARTVNAKRKLFSEHERFRVAFELAGVGIGLVDQHGRFFEVNGHLAEMFGIPKSQLVGTSLGNLSVPEGDSRALNPTKTATNCSFGQLVFEKRFLSANGKVIWAEVSCRPGGGSTESPEFLVASFHDITERKFLQNALEKQASVDSLTTALNRLSFDDRAHGELQRSGRHGYKLSLVMADLDLFKAVNDNYGHTAGDHVLSVFGEITRSCLRTMDLFGRWGGEEFLILLPDTGPSGAKRVCERIRSALEAHDFPGGFKVTTSLGVASRRAGENFSSLLDRADAAMYQAKRDGRNRVYISLDDLRRESVRRPDRLGRLEMHWRKVYACGNPQIDAEHQQKFKIANRILAAMSSDPEGAAVGPLFEQLLTHIEEHFKHEEAFLEAIAYPQFEAHQQSHRNLLALANDFATRYRNKEITAGALFGFIIHDIVATHTMREDRKYYSWIKKVRPFGGKKRRSRTDDDGA